MYTHTIITQTVMTNAVPADWDPTKTYRSGNDSVLKSLQKLSDNLKSTASVTLFDSFDQKERDELKQFAISPAAAVWTKNADRVPQQLAYLQLCKAVRAVQLLFETERPLFGEALAEWLEGEGIRCTKAGDLFTCEDEPVVSTLQLGQSLDSRLTGI